MASGITIRVSAPGKVILFGEHSVVYNKTAVAASLDLRTSGRLDLRPIEEKEISLHFIDVQLKIAFHLDRVKVLFKVRPEFTDQNWESNLQRIDETLLSTITFENDFQRISGRAFALLLWHILQDQKDQLVPFHLEISSQLILGAGMGSSASFGVVLAASLLQYQKYILSGNCKPLNDHDLNLIRDFSLLSEKLAHKQPSGIDNAICTFGGVISFQKSPAHCERIQLNGPPLRVIFVNSGVARNTATLVARVRNLQTRLPHVFLAILESFDAVACEAIDQLKSPGGPDHQKISDLIRMNHALLRGIGVSHPALEKIVSIAEEYDVACKLTGAGGGGFAYILAPNDQCEEETLVKNLQDNNFEAMVLELACQGVKDDSLRD